MATNICQIFDFLLLFFHIEAQSSYFFLDKKRKEIFSLPKEIKNTWMNNSVPDFVS